MEDVLFIPLECLHSQHDSITYVFRKNGLKTVKQEVIVGETNANDAVIEGGLSMDDRIFLSVPAGLDGQEIELLPQLNGKRKKKDEDKSKPALQIVAKPVSN